MKDDKGGVRHPILQTIFFIMGIYLFILIAQTYVLWNETCFSVVSNSTSSGATTSYSYTSYCTTKNTNTADLFFWIINKLFYFVAAYFVFYTLWEYGLGPWLKKRNERFGGKR